MESGRIRLVKGNEFHGQQKNDEKIERVNRVKEFFHAVVEDTLYIKSDYGEGVVYRRSQPQGESQWEGGKWRVKDLLSSQYWAFPGSLAGILALLGKEAGEEIITDPAFSPNAVYHAQYVSHLGLGAVGVAAGIGFGAGLVGDNLRSWWIGKQIRRGKL